jgi:hypothetical protein
MSNVIGVEMGTRRVARTDILHTYVYTGIQCVRVPMVGVGVGVGVGVFS